MTDKEIDEEKAAFDKQADEYFAYLDELTNPQRKYASIEAIEVDIDKSGMLSKVQFIEFAILSRASHQVSTMPVNMFCRDLFYYFQQNSKQRTKYPKFYAGFRLGLELGWYELG